MTENNTAKAFVKKEWAAPKLTVQELENTNTLAKQDVQPDGEAHHYLS